MGDLFEKTSGTMLAPLHSRRLAVQRGSRWGALLDLTETATPRWLKKGKAL